MIGSRLRQVLSPALILAFGLGVLGGAYGLHSCPRHAAMAPGGPVPAGHADAGAAADRNADGAPGVAVVDATTGHDGGDAGASFCICVGSCHAGAAAAHPGSPSFALTVSPMGVGAVTRVDRGVPPRATPAYFLPYPLGPPAA